VKKLDGALQGKGRNDECDYEGGDR